MALLAKRLFILVGALLAVALLAYLILLIINRSDVPPSALAQEYISAYESRPTVADSDNAYHYIFSTFGKSDKPYQQMPSESEFAVALAEDCQQAHAKCLDFVAEQQHGAALWIAEHQWVLDQYFRLLSYTQFQEPLPDYWLSNYPDYGRPGYGQRLLMMSAMLAAVNGDQPRVVALLEADLRFWRMVLENTDLLITRMIAADYVRSHFIQGNLVLRALHVTRRQHTLPLVWLDEVSAAEKSMRRALTGEWMFMAQGHAQYKSNETFFFAPEASPYEKTLTRIKFALLSPLYQVQDSNNTLAAEFEATIRHHDVSYIDLAQIVSSSPPELPQRPAPYSRLYNIVGDAAIPSLALGSRYFARTADIEGVRRAAVAATLLREREVSPVAVKQKLARLELTNPYTNEPFQWNPETREIVFQGLDKQYGSDHRIRY